MMSTVNTSSIVPEETILNNQPPPDINVDEPEKEEDDDDLQIPLFLEIDIFDHFFLFIHLSHLKMNIYYIV